MAWAGSCCGNAQVPVISLLCDDKTEKYAHLPPTSPQKNILPPTLFIGVTVFIAVSDKQTNDTIATAMELVGSVVCIGSPLLADLVVTNVADYKFPEIPRSRGYKLANGVIKYPKIVYLEQIPWVFERRRIIKTSHTPISPQKVTKRRDEKKMMVVVDDSGIYRPSFKVFETPVKLYTYKRKVDGLTSCPFNPIPEEVRRRGKFTREEKKEKSIVLNSPQDKGYCELCNMSYDIAEEHHASFDHQRNGSVLKWAEFDFLAEALFKKATW